MSSLLDPFAEKKPFVLSSNPYNSVFTRIIVLVAPCNSSDVSRFVCSSECSIQSIVLPR